MNAWPTLREWWQFAGTLALELAIVFVAAKLVMLRLRSATWQRAVWQMAMVAMLLVAVGELNGVRSWLSLPEKVVQPVSQRKVFVTIKDAEPDPALFRESMTTAPVAEQAGPTAARPSRWAQHTVWPALVWAMGLALFLARMVIAQGMALALRTTARRNAAKVEPLALRAVLRTRLAARGFPPVPLMDDATLHERAHRIALALGIRRAVALLTSKRAIAPFTFGVWRPAIVLPQNFSATFTAEQQEVALAHELAHVAGLDSAWRGFSQFTCAILWWHPLVWLAKRELDHASELVADESSLLLADGPDRLAECLVACAKELRRPALAGWLGMDGGGFRSALGKRVARLLQLQSHGNVARRVPWHLRLIAPMVCTALLWAGATALTKPAAAGDSAWSRSILGSAFAAAADDKAPNALPKKSVVGVATIEATHTNQHTDADLDAEVLAVYLDVVKSIRPVTPAGSASATTAEDKAPAIPPNKPETEVPNLQVARLTQDGKRFYEMGQYEAARTNLQTALRINPKHPGAAYYLDLVEYQLSAVAAHALQAHRPSVTNSAGKQPTDPKRQAIYEKLRQTRMKQWGPIDNLPLSEVVRRLDLDMRQFAPDGTQVSFIISSTVSPAVRETGPDGLPVPAPTPVDLNGAVVRLATSLRDVSFEEVLNSLLVTTEIPIQYSVESFAVVFSPKATSKTPFHTRFFRIDTETLVKGLNAMLPPDSTERTAPKPNPGNPARSGGITETNSLTKGTVPGESVLPTLQKWFKTLGVDLSEPGKAVFFNERLGTLMVRATQEELDAIEKGIQFANTAPPQLTIRVKVFEVERDGRNKPGFDWYFGNLGVTNGVPSPARPAQDLTVQGLRNAAPQAATITGILTDEQFRSVVKALEQRSGTDLLSAPEVTTLSGRQAQIKVVDIKYIVTDLDVDQNPKPDKAVIQPIAEPFELGPVIDVVPYVAVDGQTIQMSVLTSLKEFLGYDDPGDFKASVGGDKLTSPTPLPKFRMRSAVTSATVIDGQTLVIGAGTARHLKQQHLPDGTVTNTFTEKELFYFITPRLINAAGNALHAPEELPQAHNRTR